MSEPIIVLRERLGDGSFIDEWPDGHRRHVRYDGGASSSHPAGECPDCRGTLWLPRFVERPIQTFGEEWPAYYLVEKWERNERGEQRYVATRFYVPDPNKP